MIASRVSGKNDFSAVGEVFTIAGGEPVRILGYILGNSNTTNTNSYNAHVRNGNTIIAQHEVKGSDTVIVDTAFIADQGFSIELESLGGGAGAADVAVTVFHSHPGV